VVPPQRGPSACAQKVGRLLITVSIDWKAINRSNTRV
jgi:hypothetical protein